MSEGVEVDRLFAFYAEFFVVRGWRRQRCRCYGVEGDGSSPARPS